MDEIDHAAISEPIDPIGGTACGEGCIARPLDQARVPAPPPKQHDRRDAAEGDKAQEPRQSSVIEVVQPAEGDAPILRIAGLGGSWAGERPRAVTHSVGRDGQRLADLVSQGRCRGLELF